MYDDSSNVVLACFVATDSMPASSTTEDSPSCGADGAGPSTAAEKDSTSPEAKETSPEAKDPTEGNFHCNYFLFSPIWHAFAYLPTICRPTVHVPYQLKTDSITIFNFVRLKFFWRYFRPDVSITSGRPSWRTWATQTHIGNPTPRGCSRKWRWSSFNGIHGELSYGTKSTTESAASDLSR